MNFKIFLKNLILNYPSKVLHQLLQRASSAALHRTGPEAAAGRVREGGHQMGPHRLLQQSSNFYLITFQVEYTQIHGFFSIRNFFQFPKIVNWKCDWCQFH